MPQVSRRERLTLSEASSICVSFIIIQIVSPSRGVALSQHLELSMQHPGFAFGLHMIIPTATQPVTVFLGKKKELSFTLS